MGQAVFTSLRGREGGATITHIENGSKSSQKWLQKGGGTNFFISFFWKSVQLRYLGKVKNFQRCELFSSNLQKKTRGVG